MFFLLRSKRIRRSDISRAPSFLAKTNVHANLISKTGYRSVADNGSQRSILTLDPTKLESKRQNVHDISLVKVVSIRFRTSRGPSITQVRFRATKDEDQITQDIPFPPESCGVFYYHVDPQQPPISGGIKFRLCDSLETFDKGEDLHTSTGKPWKISLLRIAHYDSFKGLGQLLMEQGLVQKDLFSDLKKLNPPTRFVGSFLYYLSQPLVIDLDKTAFKLHLVTRKTFSSTIFRSPFYDTHNARKPYSGLAKVRFELSTLQEHKSQGPTLILRILEFLSPVQRVLPLGSGPYMELATNTIAMRRTLGGSVKAWGYPIDVRVEGAKWKEFLAAVNEPASLHLSSAR